MTRRYPGVVPRSPLWLPMADAPKDRAILVLSDSQQCSVGYPACTSEKLCPYHAHLEVCTTVPDGPDVVHWGGGWVDSPEEGGGVMPDWWFYYDYEFDKVANPIAWCEIPSYAH